MKSKLVGFGLDAQYADKYPNGIFQLCEDYRTDLSHLSIVSLYNTDAAKVFLERCAKSLPLIHHLPGVAPADPDGPHLDLLTNLDPISRILNAKWICEDIAIWRIGPYGIPYFTPPLFDRESAKRIAQGIKKIQKISSIPFLAEVPSCSIVFGDMDLGTFFHEIVSLSGCGLVCDVSHVYSYSLAKHLDALTVLESLPLEAVKEIHISGGHVDTASKFRYIDTHSEPIPTDILELLKLTILKCPNLECVTYEVGVGLTSDSIEFDFGRIQSVLRSLDWMPKI